MVHVVFLAVLGARALGWLLGLELGVHDWYLRYRTGAGEADPRMVIVGFTNDDLKRYGHPFSDGLVADLLERLAKAGAVAIGFDLIRPDPVEGDEEGSYERLAAVLREHGSIVGVMLLPQEGQDDAFGPPPAIAAADSERVGLADIYPDRADGTVRRGLLYYVDGDAARWSLAAQLALRYLASEHGIGLELVPGRERGLRLGEAVLAPLVDEPGPYGALAELSGYYQFLLTYPSGAAPFRSVNLADALRDGADLAPVVRGRIVLFGSRASHLKDYLRAPIGVSEAPLDGALYGVTLHAHITSQLIRQALGEDGGLRPVGVHADRAWIWAWSVVGGAIGVLLPAPLSLIAATAAAAAVLAGSTLAAFVVLGWWIAVVPPLFGLLAAAALTTGYARHWERSQGKALRRLFEVYVSADIAGALWAERRSFLDKVRARPEPRVITATVLFSDIRGFTTICEAMASEPLRLHGWLNEYMEAMVEIITDHGGVIEKFAGDGVTVAFGPMAARGGLADGAAADARRAVACAVVMGERLRRLNEGWRARDLPVVSTRIGIHTGPLVVGSVGGARRMQYALIGDTANTAARIESYGKDEAGSEKDHCRILISDATYQYLEGRFAAQEFGELTLRNKLNKVLVYRVTGSGAPVPAM